MNSTESQIESQVNKMVHAVNRVNYAFLLRYPPYLHISADGYADSEGWSEPRLQAKVQSNPVREGILELDFVATPAAGISPPGRVSISAEITWKEDVYAIRGVKVYAATNDMTVTFGEQATRGK
jgi:hypothetical protein